jgi:hypothetical protein
MAILGSDTSLLHSVCRGKFKTGTSKQVDFPNMSAQQTWEYIQVVHCCELPQMKQRRHITQESIAISTTQPEHTSSCPKP